MLQLRAYTVLKAWPGSPPATEDRPYCVTRVTVDMQTQEVNHEVIADHPSRNIACYWASQLNEGRSTEEQCRAGIEAYK